LRPMSQQRLRQFHFHHAHHHHGPTGRGGVRTRR
jgi:hypothetical protein